jgi:hypothetical protein
MPCVEFEPTIPASERAKRVHASERSATVTVPVRTSNPRDQLKYTLLATWFHIGFLLGLFFDPEDGGYLFLRNVGRLSADYTGLYPRS